MPEARRMISDVLSTLTDKGSGLRGLVSAIDGAVLPTHADGFLLLVPSVTPGRLEVLPAVPSGETEQAYAGLPECALGLLKAGKQGLLSEECARCVKYGSMEEGAFRTLEWRSIVFCPLVAPGESPGAMFFWRDAQSAEFSAHETYVLERFAKLCAPLPLSMAHTAASMFDRDLAAHLEDAVVVIDHALRVLRWNPAAERLYGIPADEAIGTHLGLLYSTFYDDPAMDRDQAWAQLQASGTWQGFVTQQSKANKTVSVHATVTKITDAAGAFIGAVAINRDTSELVQARSRITLTEGLLAAALDAAGAMAVVLDDSGTIVAANREWLDKALAAGARMDQVRVGANYVSALQRAADAGETDAELALAAIEAVLTGQVHSTSSEYQMDCQTGVFAYQVTVSRIGNPPGVVITHREITHHRQLERTLAHYDSHDSLTGLGNRQLLERRIAARMETDDVTTEMGLIVYDVDGFAAVNEALGYSAGDQVLQILAERFRELCPPGCTAYRLGGDQFGVFKPATTHASLKTLAEALIAQIGSSLTVVGQDLRLTFSAGVATVSTGDALDVAEQTAALIAQADAARIESKVRGRNRVNYYRPDLQQRALGLTQPNEFLTDLDAGRIHMHYQQIRRLDDDSVMGFEGLLRWHRGDAGILPAGAFAQLLAAPLVAGPLARWGIARVATDVQRLVKEYPDRDLHLGVNISAQQFLDVDVANAVESAISRGQIPHHSLVVEVTESTAFTDDQRVLGQLQRMHEYGITIALDDFGTGFSSLQHLQSLPANAVKVDRSFTAGVCVDRTSAALVRALIGLAHDLGLWVVAEGVESQDQRQWLADAGCDFYQGFLAHRPASLQDCLTTLSDG